MVEFASKDGPDPRATAAGHEQVHIYVLQCCGKKRDILRTGSPSVDEVRPTILTESCAPIDDAACMKINREHQRLIRESPISERRHRGRTDKRRHGVAVKPAGTSEHLLLEDSDDVGEDECPATSELASIGRRQEIAGKDGAFCAKKSESCRVALIGR